MTGGEDSQGSDARDRGVVLALNVLGAGDAGFAYLPPERRSLCARLWRGMERGPGNRAAADSPPAMAAILPDGLARLHPSWFARALADEPSDIVHRIVAALPATLQALVSVEKGGAASPSPSLPACVEGAVLRLALGRLAALCPSVAGPQAEALYALGFSDLRAEVCRMGARTLGQSLADAPPAALARVMVAVGDPWAREVLTAARRATAGGAQAATAVLSEAAHLKAPPTPAERLLQVGALTLGPRLEAEHPDSRAKVAGRLPAPIGRLLLGAQRCSALGWLGHS